MSRGCGQGKHRPLVCVQHEHATCFCLGDRGLVVISSCGHAGIINILKHAQEVSGVEKIYALA